MGQDVLRLAAHEQAGDATTSMRRHHDEVAGATLRDLDSRAQGVGELDARLNGALRENGSIRGQKQVFEHWMLSLTPAFQGGSMCGCAGVSSHT